MKMMTWKRRQAQDPALEHLLDNVTTLALNPDHRDIRHMRNAMSSICLYPQLEEVARKLIEKRYNEEITKSKQESLLSDPLQSLRDLNEAHAHDLPQREAALNIPLYEQATSRIMRPENTLPIPNNERSLDIETEPPSHQPHPMLHNF